MSSCTPFGFKAIPLKVAQLSLSAVLKCGQSFRWTAIPLAGNPTSDTSPFEMEYRLTLRDRVICLRQSPDTLFYRAVFPDASPIAESTREEETQAWLRDYFQLDVDLIALYNKWSEMDPVFGGLKTRFEGIRMLRQDPWENLVSFICSQNNHISRITNMVQSLCTNFSPALVSIPHPCSTKDTLTYYPFPSPAALAAPDTSTVLRSLGFGYRAEYIQRTAQMLVEEHGKDGAEDFINRLRQRSTEEAREELLKFVGVGRKVADCVLLMSLDKREVVPVDTHVHQIAMKHYGMRGSGNKVTMTPKLYNELQMRLAGVWGEYAGWAHSILFTADLKSFSSYGLPTPSPSVSPTSSSDKLVVKGKKKTKVIEAADNDVPPPSTKKRKFVSSETKSELIRKEVTSTTEGCLADRVKRRRLPVIRGSLEAVPA